jgi:23S rRNA pseudouridine955/2504/2580 synthase
MQTGGGIEKRYQALLSGVIDRDRFVVDAPLRKNVLRSGERVVRVDAEGKPSRTHFRVLRRFANATLVEARLETGRTHQIRVHAQHLGHRILGDDKYGLDADNQKFRELGLKRLFLHAISLEFRWPDDAHTLRVEAPLPDDLQRLLKVLSGS